METYKKAYAHLVGKVDEALTLLDAGNPFVLDAVREILSQALLDAEDLFINCDGTVHNRRFIIVRENSLNRS